MKEYSFEYTKQGITYLLLLLSFGIIAIVMVVFSQLLTRLPLLALVLSIGLPVLFFLFNKHHIKRIGKAELSENGVVLYLSEVKQIFFSELKYYYVQEGKNVTLFTLGFLDGTKLNIGANNNFCNDEPFVALLTHLQSNIEAYKAKNQLNIIHLESAFARKNAFYVLIFITLLVILGYLFTRLPIMIISIAFTLPIIFGWISYFQLKRNNKLVDF